MKRILSLILAVQGLFPVPAFALRAPNAGGEESPVQGQMEAVLRTGMEEAILYSEFLQQGTERKIDFIGPYDHPPYAFLSSGVFRELKGKVRIGWDLISSWKMGIRITYGRKDENEVENVILIKPSAEEPSGISVEFYERGKGGSIPLQFRGGANNLYDNREGNLLVLIEVTPSLDVVVSPYSPFSLVSPATWRTGPARRLLETLPEGTEPLSVVLLNRLKNHSELFRTDVIRALARLDYSSQPALRETVLDAFLDQLGKKPLLSSAEFKEKDAQTKLALIEGFQWLSVDSQLTDRALHALRPYTFKGTGQNRKVVEAAKQGYRRLEGRLAKLQPDEILKPPAMDAQIHLETPIQPLKTLIGRDEWPGDEEQRLRIAKILRVHPDTQAAQLLLSRFDPASREPETVIRRQIVISLAGRNYLQAPEQRKEAQDLFIRSLHPAAQQQEWRENDPKIRREMIRRLLGLTASAPDLARNTFHFLEILSNPKEGESEADQREARSVTRLLRSKLESGDMDALNEAMNQLLEEVGQAVSQIPEEDIQKREYPGAPWVSLENVSSYLKVVQSWMATLQATVTHRNFRGAVLILRNILKSLRELDQYSRPYGYDAARPSLKVLEAASGLSAEKWDVFNAWLDRTTWEMKEWKKEFQWLSGPNAGLEERRLSVLVRKAEATGSTGVVVLDVSELERAPELVPVIRQFRRFADRLVLLGESDAARKLADHLAIQGRIVQYVPERSPDAVTTALERLGGRGLGGVSYFGPEEAVQPVRVAAEVLGLNFDQPAVSIEMILRGFGVDPELAAELATEIEQAIGLGREA